MFVYTMQPVLQPVDQPVRQPVVARKRGFTVSGFFFSRRLADRFPSSAQMFHV